MDIASLNVDKNNKTIRTNHKNIENQINPLISTRKKTRFYQTKIFTVEIFQENNSQITIITTDNKHLIDITIAEDIQMEYTHKRDIVDQTVKTSKSK